MRKSLSLLMLVAVCATLLAVTAVAQTDQKTDDMQGPPKVLYIIREEVKPGKNIAHNQHEAAWTQAYVKANFTTPALGLTSVTGPDEDWFLTGYESFAALEKDTDRMQKDPALSKVNLQFSPAESDYVNESRTIVARYKPDYSYKADFKLGEYHYFSVNVIRTKLGEDMTEFYKALNSAREKAALDTHTVVYQVQSGMPAGTLIVFMPIKDLSRWDEAPSQAYDAALKEIKWSEMVGKYIMNVDMRLYAFNPRLSVVPESVAALDPAFWHPKPQTMMTKSEPAKKVKPAAKKADTTSAAKE